MSKADERVASFEAGIHFRESLSKINVMLARVSVSRNANEWREAEALYNLLNGSYHAWYGKRENPEISSELETYRKQVESLRRVIAS